MKAKFLLRNGADEVIYPELEVATSIAVSESSDSIFDCIRLTAVLQAMRARRELV